ncbi:hypothetical protein ACFWM5_39790 [Streptomyces bobili]
MQASMMESGVHQVVYADELFVRPPLDDASGVEHYNVPRQPRS